MLENIKMWIVTILIAAFIVNIVNMEKKSIWKRSCMICIRLFQMLLDQCLAPGPVYSHSGTVEG